ncbi:MAG: hypothetical protein WC658_05005 [Candidatus Omnitrophota bacterium]
MMLKYIDLKTIFNNRARNFLSLTVVIALVCLTLRFAIERLIKFNITQNELNASATLKLISVSLENYAKDHEGNFPKDLSLLTHSTPAYLDKDYISRSFFKGYEYECNRLDPLGYSCSASPVRCNLSGEKIFTISSGALLVSEDCDRKK